MSEKPRFNQEAVNWMQRYKSAYKQQIEESFVRSVVFSNVENTPDGEDLHEDLRKEGMQKYLYKLITTPGVNPHTVENLKTLANSIQKNTLQETIEYIDKNLPTVKGQLFLKFLILEEGKDSSSRVLNEELYAGDLDEALNDKDEKNNVPSAQLEALLKKAVEQSEEDRVKTKEAVLDILDADTEVEETVNAVFDTIDRKHAPDFQAGISSMPFSSAHK